MLKSIKIKNLTVFESESLEFSQYINIFIGENGAGKSNLLKVIYSILSTNEKLSKKDKEPSKSLLQKELANKLINVFKPDSLGNLVNRAQSERCELEFIFHDSKLDIGLSFSAASKSEVQIDKLNFAWGKDAVIFLPTREMLSLYPNFISIYDGYFLQFDETYRDICVLMGTPQKKQNLHSQSKSLLPQMTLPLNEKTSSEELLSPLEKAMGGKLDLEPTGRFYLIKQDRKKIEMPLLAEGLRKLGMLSQLISNGVLFDTGYLLWDEPEANLNPKLLKVVAETILLLAKNGVQIFIATHSLFLLKELDILANDTRFQSLKQNYFSLVRVDGENSSKIEIEKGNSITDLDTIVSLDEAIEQADRVNS